MSYGLNWPFKKAKLPTMSDHSKIDLSPYTKEELWAEFEKERGSANKHLLTLYSLIVGVNAKRILDLGIGSTTRAVRSAAQFTKGKVYSCDFDRKRFLPLLEQQTDDWHLELCGSSEFLSRMEGPFDFAFHDAAHDYWQTKTDLKLILPKMRQFSLICIHDTQCEEAGPPMLKALHEVADEFPVTFTHLPYSQGLTILRVEESSYSHSPPPWHKGGNFPKTKCLSDFDLNFSTKKKMVNWMRTKAGILKKEFQDRLT